MARKPILPDLIATWEPALQKAFQESIANIRNPASFARIVELAEARDVEGLMRELRINPTSFRPLDKALLDAYEAGGNHAADVVGQPRGAKVVVQFDIRNPRAEDWLRSHSSTLIREITDDQREVIRETLAAGMTAGKNPRNTALDLVGRINPATKKREGGIVGLTASQEGWARRYEAELQAGDLAALTRKLRDQRFDGAVKKAVADGKPIPAEKIAAMVAAYRNRALRHRAEAIARTETLTAMNAASFENARQMVERGQAPFGLTKTWHSGRDSRVRETHRHLDGQAVPLQSRFRSDSGATLAFPGDPSAPPAERIQCRCWMSVGSAANFFAGLT